jgi:integrase
MTDLSMISPPEAPLSHSHNTYSVNDLLDWFEQTKVPAYRSQSTAKSICRILRTQLGSLNLRTIKGQDIARYRDKRISDGISGSSVIRELNLLSRAIKLGNSELSLELSSNPAISVQRPRANRPRNRRPTPEELELLINRAHETSQPMLATAIIFAIETGMRQGEITGLKWVDVNLETGVANLERTKNGESRQVPLRGKVRALLLDLKESRPIHSSGDYIFNNWRNSHGLAKAWRRLCSKAKVRDLRFHDLRHEAASRFFERGLNQFQVAAITGHKSLQMLKRYTHLKVLDLVDLLDCLNQTTLDRP